MTGKPWPNSESEFVIPEAQAAALGRHVRWCPNPQCGGWTLLDWHVTAVTAEVSLRACAERYYTAAGFRD